MTHKSFQIYQDQPFIPKDYKVMCNLWFIYPHRILLSFIVESIDILTASAWLFIEYICRCSSVLCCYQHGRNTGNYCNYYCVTAMTFEMNTNFEEHFIHPFHWKLLKIFYCQSVTLQNMIDSLRNKRYTFSLSYCWALSTPITVRKRQSLLVLSM